MTDSEANDGVDNGTAATAHRAAEAPNHHMPETVSLEAGLAGDLKVGLAGVF